MEMQLHKITVEELQEKDLQWFVETAAVNMLVDEVKRPELVDMDQLYALAYRGMTSGTAWVAKDNGTPVGALGSIIVPNLFNPRIITLVEIFWYVLPEYRNGRAGALLLNTFSNEGGKVAHESTLSLLPSSSINLNSLEKRGFHMGEYAFHKRNII